MKKGHSVQLLYLPGGGVLPLTEGLLDRGGTLLLPLLLAVGADTPAVLVMVFLEALPNSTVRTLHKSNYKILIKSIYLAYLAAKLREQKVSSALYSTGLTQTIIRVLLS